jgi:hypothetical protein
VCIQGETERGKEVFSNEKFKNIFKVGGTVVIAEDVWDVELNHQGLKMVRSRPYPDRTH